MKMGRETQSVPRDDVTARELARGILEHLGFAALPWSKAQQQLLARVGDDGGTEADADRARQSEHVPARGGTEQDVQPPQQAHRAALAQHGRSSGCRNRQPRHGDGIPKG